MTDAFDDMRSLFERAIPELITTYAPLSYGLLFSFGLIAFLLLVSFVLGALPSRAPSMGGGGGMAAPIAAVKIKKEGRCG